MEFFKIRRDIPFMRHALKFNIVSAITFIVAGVLLATRALPFAMEFTGGPLVEVHYTHPADIDKIRDSMLRAGYADMTVQNFGSSSEVVTRMPAKAGQSTTQISEQVMSVLHKDDPSAELRRVEFVGPQIGSELATSGL